MEYDVIVIGGGPGGYVVAIKASQLGLTTACIEFDEDDQGKQKLGGTCLNVGCIPSKSLLDSSYKYHQIAESFDEHGIKVSKPNYDLKKMMERKNDIVKKLTGGVSHLFSHNKVEAIHGKGRLLNQNEVEVTDLKGKKKKLKRKITLWIRISMSIMDTKKGRVVSPTPIPQVLTVNPVGHWYSKPTI